MRQVARRYIGEEVDRELRPKGILMQDRVTTKKKRATPKMRKMDVQKAKKPSKPQPSEAGDKLSFNRAMVYVKDVQRALEFYHDLLGFKMVDEFRHEGKPVYARLRAPGGDGTIALHMAGPGNLACERGRTFVL